MPVSVHELRLSLVWTKVFARDASLPSLSDPNQYRDAFEAARTGQKPWLLPWTNGCQQRFWQFYLGGATETNLAQIAAAEARSFFVPLRLEPFCHVASQDGTTATLEGFCYPHSTAVIATVRLRPAAPVPLNDMIDATVKARNDDYTLRWHDASLAATHGSLQSLADKVVARLHAQAGIDPNAVGLPLPPPLTTAVTIDAEGDEDKEVLRRALHGLCWLRRSWRTDELTQPLPGPETRSGIAIDRNRAIWLPKFFSSSSHLGRKVALGCYLRNLTLAAMQTAALAALVGRAEEVFDDPKGRLLRIAPSEVARAIKLLGKFGADGDDFFTYRSWTAQYQTSFYKDRVQKVQKELGS